MPVLVVGADHPLGDAIARRLAAPDREVRAFVSQAAALPGLRRAGIKVAVGDLSDDSHIAGAAINCFAIVFVEPALTDGRELAFASPRATVVGWTRAAADAKVTRVIWVGSGPPALTNPEVVLVTPGGRPAWEITEEVARLDDAGSLS
jgi:nucleoside-diphosphate-sugar epimerase